MEITLFEVEFDMMHQPQCNCGRKDSGLCKKAQRWWNKLALLTNYKELYINLVLSPFNTSSLENALSQINLDIPRTVPGSQYFSSGEGSVVLKRVLMACAKYNSSVGYIQGMNFVGAALLWHSGEIEAFYMLLSIMDDYKARDNYLEGLPGVLRHIHILEYCLLEENDSCYQLLNELSVSLSLLCSDWVMTLFCNMIPIEETHEIFELFFDEGWTGFYKLTLAILNRLYCNAIKGSPIEFIHKIKSFETLKSNAGTFVAQLKKTPGEKLTWRKLTKEAKTMKLNENAIDCLNYNWRSLS